MNIENTLQDFLSGFIGRIENAGGVTEIYYAFSTLYNGSKWIEHCHQNMIEIYSGAKHLIEQIENNDTTEEIWPTLDDLSFHAAIFGNYYHIFQSIFTEILTDKGLSWNDPKEIMSNRMQSSLNHVLKNGIASFERLMESFIKKDIIAQHKYLNEFYLVSSQLQCIAASSRLNT